MDALRLSKSVRRVTVLEKDGTGATTPIIVFKGRKKKKKQSRAFMPAEQLLRRIADAQGTFGDEYLARHRRSNRKNSDGWIRDLALNMARSSRKGAKRLRLNRWLEI